MSPGIPFTTTTRTTTQTTEEDTVQPVVVTKQTVTTQGESQTTKDTSVSATVTTTTKNTNLAPNFVQPGGPFPPFVSTVSTAPSAGLASGTAAPGSTASGASPIPAASTSAASVVNPGSSPVLTFVPNNPAQEIDVTTPSVTSTKETDITKPLTPTITSETDATSSDADKKGYDHHHKRYRVAGFNQPVRARVLVRRCWKGRQGHRLPALCRDGDLCSDLPDYQRRRQRRCRSHDRSTGRRSRARVILAEAWHFYRSVLGKYFDQKQQHAGCPRQLSILK